MGNPNVPFAETTCFVVAQHLGVDRSQIRPTDRFDPDLGLLPLDVVLIALRIEEFQGVQLPIERLEQVRTVADLSALLHATVMARHSGHESA